MADEYYTLSREQATSQRWTFALPGADDGTWVDFNDYTAYSEIRTKEKDGDLVLSLTELFTVMDGHVDETDTGSTVVTGKWLVLDILGHHDAGLELPSKDGWYDIFCVNEADHSQDVLLIQGPVTFDPATTDMSGAGVES